MDKNHTEGTKHGFKRTMKDMLGKAPYKRKGAADGIEKPTDKAAERVGQAADDTRDARMGDDFDRIRETRRWSRYLHIPGNPSRRPAL